MRLQKHLSILVLLFFWICNTCYGQFTIPEKPKKQTAVYDAISLFSTTEKKQLQYKLKKYADSTSTQIVVAAIGSTKGENINYLGAQWGHSWGIGQEKKDNGVFILIAKDDRKISIQNGFGVEHLLTDALSKRIIENIIAPGFRKGQFYHAIDKATDAIISILQGEYKEERSFKNKKSGNSVFIALIIFIVIIFFISKSGKNGGSGGNKGHRSGGGFDLGDFIILSNMGRSGGGFGGSSSGGGFDGGFGGGFGGGGFGGGGASGGW